MSIASARVLIRWLAFASLLALPTVVAAQVVQFSSLATPSFVQVGEGRWSIFPNSGAVLAVHGPRVALHNRNTGLSIEMNLPAGWLPRVGDSLSARFRVIRSDESRELEGAASLVFEDPVLRSDGGQLTARFNTAQQLELHWRADQHGELPRATLQFAGALDSEVTKVIDTLQAGGAAYWDPKGSDRFELRESPGGRGIELASESIVQQLPFGSFLGGSGKESLVDLLTLPSGDVAVTGATTSLDFPVTVGSYDPDPDSALDCFLVQLSRDGSALEFATFFGSTEGEIPVWMAIDSDGTILVAGVTEGDDYPTTSGAFDETWNGGGEDSFISRFSEDGSALLHSTFLGGPGVGPDRINSMVVLPADGSVVVGAQTCSNGWPSTPGTFNPQALGDCDGVVSRLSSDLSTLLASTFVGSPASDPGAAVFEAPGDGLFITQTMPAGWVPQNLPITLEGAGALPDANSSHRLYLASVAPDLSTLNWSTWKSAGGRPDPQPDGSIVFAGGTKNFDAFHTTPGVFNEEPLGTTDFELAVHATSANHEKLLWATYIAVEGGSQGWRDSAIDDEGRIFIVGTTAAASFPFTSDAFDTTITGVNEPYLAVLSPDGTELLYSSLMGVGQGSTLTEVFLALDNCGGAFIAGDTAARTWPTTPGAHSETYQGAIDGFVLRMTALSPWGDLGKAVQGVAGRPNLAPTGPLCEGDPTAITLTRGPGSGVAFLVLGFSELSAPFKGGTFVPTPDVICPLSLDAQGEVSLKVLWPPGIASDTKYWLQAWMPDATALAGYSATNAVLATTP